MPAPKEMHPFFQGWPGQWHFHHRFPTEDGEAPPGAPETRGPTAGRDALHQAPAVLLNCVKATIGSDWLRVVSAISRALSQFTMTGWPVVVPGSRW